ncbi:endonuclease/exonuclease/phosphatase family protein [Dactylosporangium darangshiense]|uniref:endonuclease/exonuclease/phosphatase family protein n=1 Tax=Dactylosporangium darangshiense TaxID=579108 RepID=UPI003635D6A8
MTLKLMTYNIKNGGGDRLDAIGRVIAGEAPDVVAVQEMRGEPALGAATGMRQLVARSWRGQPVGLLVARHLRVIAAGRVARPFFHAAVWARLATPLGPLTVVGAHLYPYWGRARRAEAGWLAAFIKSQGESVLLADLNTLDPYSDHAVELATLPMPYRRRHLRRLGGGPTWGLRRCSRGAGSSTCSAAAAPARRGPCQRRAAGERSSPSCAWTTCWPRRGWPGGSPAAAS